MKRRLPILLAAVLLVAPAFGADMLYQGQLMNPRRAVDMGDGTWADVVVVVQGGPNRYSAVLINSSATTLTEIRAAPGAALSLYITDILASASVAATVTADQQLTLKYGTGTNCGTGTTAIWSHFNAVNDGPSVRYSTPIKVPANNALCFIHAAAGNKSVVVNGYIAP